MSSRSGAARIAGALLVVVTVAAAAARPATPTSPSPAGGTAGREATAPSIPGPASGAFSPAARGERRQVGPTLPIPRTPVLVRRGTSTGRRVAFTFDAGSDRGNAEGIVDLLAARRLRATFGLTGRWIDDNPDLVRRMVADGHTFINHSYSHPSLTGSSTHTPRLDAAEIREELDRAEAALNHLGGIGKPWFRPPYADFDARSLGVVAANGYPFIALYSVDSRGWLEVPASEVLKRCLDGAAPGAIYLFHVGSRSTDYAALGAVIDGLVARGYAIGDLASVF